MGGERERLRCLIGDRRYEVELKALRRGTIDQTRTAVDQAGEPSDGTLSPTAAWKRTIENFTGGAGQVWADLVDTSERNRHRRSSGIVPFQYRSLRLGKGFETARTTDGVVDVEYVPYGSAARFAYGPDGANAFVFSGTDWSPVASTGVAITGTIADITTDGVSTFVGTSTGTFVIDSAGVAAAFGTSPVKALHHCGGRMLGATTAGTIVEYDSAGVETVVFTHWAATADWLSKGIVSAGSTFYAAIAGWGLGRAEIYSFTQDDATTAFVPRLALAMPEDEEIRAVAGTTGLLVLGTSKGFRLALVETDGSLTLGPLWGSHLEGIMPPPYVQVMPHMAALSICGGQAGALLAWEPFIEGPAERTNNACVLLADLSRFTSELTPAWAIYGKTGGSGGAAPKAFMLRDRLDLGETGGLVCLAQVEDLQMVVGDSDLYATGEWWSGRFTFGTPERKRYQSIELEVADCPTGASILVEAITADGEVTVGTITTAGRHQLALDPTIEADWLEVHLTLTRGTDPQTGPNIERLTLRARPLPERVDEIYVPIINVRTVTSEVMGAPVSFSPWDEYQYLRTLMDSGEVVRFELGDEVLPVTIDGLFLDGSDPNTRINGWTKGREWIEGVLVVKLQTVPGVSAPASTEDATVIDTEEPDHLLTEDGFELEEE